jgi:hypothetical protein
MHFRLKLFRWALLLASSLATGAAVADTYDDFRTSLYEGRVADAIKVAEAAVTADPNDGKARFALGLAQSLDAIEGLGHGLYQFGLRSEFEPSTMTMGLYDAPFLRLPIPENPAPSQVTYEGLRDLLKDLTDGLATAQSTLAKVGPAEFELSLDLQRVHLDFDRNGQISDRESLVVSFLAVTGPVTAPSGFVFDFDQSDAPWLEGYCNLLMAMGKFLQAHDWSTAVNSTFHQLFPNSDLASASLSTRSRLEWISKKLESLLNPDGSLPDFDPESDSDYNAYTQLLKQQYELANPSGYDDLALFESVADLVAFVHLFNWPVVDPPRMSEARLHLLEMIALSRENWARIHAETDDSREWVPGPHQTGMFENLQVNEVVLEGWTLFLDEFEAILTGERLVPHWRIEGRGINVRKMFEEPRTFDPVMIGQGTAILPYLEEGELIGEDTVWTIFGLTEGGFLSYFLWFN